MVIVVMDQRASHLLGNYKQTIHKIAERVQIISLCFINQFQLFSKCTSAGYQQSSHAIAQAVPWHRCHQATVTIKKHYTPDDISIVVAQQLNIRHPRHGATTSNCLEGTQRTIKPNDRLGQAKAIAEIVPDQSSSSRWPASSAQSRWPTSSPSARLGQ